MAISVFANNIGDSGNVFNNEDVVYTLVSLENENYFKQATYDKTTQDMYFNTTQEVEFLQILDQSGELLYQIPLGTDKVYVSLKEFSSGHFTVNMLFKGTDKMISAKMEKL